MLSGSVKETICPVSWSAAQVAQHITELFALPDTDIQLRRAGALVDGASGTVEALAGDSDRLDLEGVLMWRFAGVAAASPNEALLEASGWGHSSSVTRLLSWDADPGVVAADDWLQQRGIRYQWAHGSVALHVAAYAGNADAITALLEGRACLETSTHDGTTALYFASHQGHHGAAERLLALRAAVDAADDWNVTPLSAASREGHTLVVELLLAHGAAINVATDYGFTPLAVATDEGNLGVFELLLEHGAALDVADQYGYTPLCHAAGHGEDEMVEMLLARGAAADAVTRDDATPLFLAESTAERHGHQGALRAAQLLRDRLRAGP